MSNMDVFSLMACYFGVGLLWAFAVDWDEYQDPECAFFTKVSVNWFGFLSKVFMWPLVIAFWSAISLIICLPILVYSLIK